jgi:enoyl-CoA hydratase/carnithine racemase
LLVPEIEIRRRGPIGEIRFNRPEVLNAQGVGWPEEMVAAVRELNDDDAIRVILLTAEGRSFCSGLDLDDLVAGRIGLDWLHRGEHPMRAIETADKAVLAGIRGHCLGGGLQIAIACDVRIAAAGAVFGLPAAQEGLLPGISTWRLPRLIGMGNARHLILSGETITAEEAHRIGLVNRVVADGDLEHELERSAERYLAVPAPSVKWAKRLSNQAFDLPFDAFVQSYDRAAKIVLDSPEHHEARRAWRERKARRTTRL